MPSTRVMFALEATEQGNDHARFRFVEVFNEVSRSSSSPSDPRSEAP